MVEKAFDRMSEAVIAFLEESYEKAEKKTEETIRIEKEHDRLREKITERLFTRETMAFSRTDRLKIIESLDRIVDKAEIVVRKLIEYRHAIDQPIKKGIEELAKMNKIIGKEIKNLVIAVFEDFEKGKEYVKKITDIRRDVREVQWEMLEANYRAHPEDYLVFDHTHNLIKDLCKAADRAEEFADQIYGLICKYSL